MSLNNLLEKLKTAPQSVEFDEVIATIEANYDYSETRFTNGDQVNEAGTNGGSCKILAFGQLNDLSVDQTLNCFGKYYREDVLQNPEGDDHGNIRNFMDKGWDGVSFDSAPLTAK